MPIQSNIPLSIKAERLRSSAAVLASMPEVGMLVQQGQPQQALFVAQSAAGPVATWRRVDDMILAAELLGMCGAPRRGESLAIRAWLAEPQNLQVRRVNLELALDRKDLAAVWERGCQGAIPGPISAEAVQFLCVLGRGWWALGEQAKAEQCWRAAAVDDASAALVECERFLAMLASGEPLPPALAFEVEKRPKRHWRLTLAVIKALAAAGEGKRALHLLKGVADGTEWAVFFLLETELWLHEGNAALALVALDKFESAGRLADVRSRQHALRLKALIYLWSGNTGRAAEFLTKLGHATLAKRLSDSPQQLVFHTAQLKAFGAFPAELSEAGFHELLDQRGWESLSDEWSLAEVAEGLEQGWLVAWPDAAGQMVMPMKVEQRMGTVLAKDGRILTWGDLSEENSMRRRRRVTVAFAPGHAIPADLAGSGAVQQESWLRKLRTALRAGEIGKGWQLLREVEGAGGPGPSLDEARGIMAEAVGGAWPVSPWQSRKCLTEQRMARFFNRKTRAILKENELVRLPNLLLEKLRWMRNHSRKWCATEWNALLSEMLATAGRTKTLPGLLSALRERWTLHADAMSLGDAVDAHQRVGEVGVAHALLEEAAKRPELKGVAQLLEARLDLLEGHVTEALSTLQTLDCSHFEEMRWHETAVDLAMGLGRPDIIQRFVVEGLRRDPSRVAWWQWLASFEAKMDEDPANGERRMWSQALRSRTGDASLYRGALEVARRVGPLRWEQLILSDWAALCPNHPALLFETGKSHLHQDRTAEALAVFEKVGEYPFLAAEASVARAEVYAKTGRAENAAGVLLDLWRSNPDEMPAWQELLKLASKAALRNDLLNEAAQALHSGKGGLPLFTAWWQAAKDQPIAAQQLLAIADIRHDLPEAIEAAAERLIAEKKDAAATELLRRGVQQHPFHGGLWKQRAKLQELVGRGPSVESALLWENAALLGNDSDSWLALAAWRESAENVSARDAAEVAANAASQGLSAGTWVALADRAHARGDAERGMRCLANALLHDPLHGQRWRLLLTRSREANQPGYASQIAEWMCQLYPQRLEMWLAAARLHLHLDSEVRFFAATQKARELAPRDVDGYSLEAQWQVRRRNYTAAQAACQPSVFGTKLEEMPVVLRGRHAWVESARGDLETAIRLMRAVLQDEPDFAWGQQEMLGWLSATGQHREAEALLAETGKEQRTLRQAKEEAGLERLEPLGEVNTVYEKLRSFDSLLQAKRLPEATKLLREMEVESPGPLVIARSVALAVSISDKDRVQSSLDALVGTKTDDRWSLEMAVDGYEKMFGRPRLLNYLERKSRILEEIKHPGVLPLWVRKLNENTWKGLPSRVLEIIQERPDALQSVLEYLNQMAVAGRKARNSRNWMDTELKAMSVACESLVNREGAFLQSRPDSWLAVGTAWNALGEPKRAYNWLEQGQPDVLTVEMLEQLMLACVGTGRTKRALEFAAQGREMDGGKATPRFFITPALEMALQKRYPEADALLESSAGSTTEDLRTSARLARTLSRLGQESGRSSFNESLRNQFWEYWLSNRAFNPQRVWKKGLRLLSQLSLSPVPMIWGFWTHNRRWIRAAFLVIGLLLVLVLFLQIKKPRLLPWNRKPTPVQEQDLKITPKRLNDT
jgi:hypothetical protein